MKFITKCQIEQKMITTETTTAKSSSNEAMQD